MRAEIFVFLLFLVIFLYAKAGGKIAIPRIGNAVGTLRSLLFREQIATTVLFALFLITFSYTFGDSWKGVFGWWWNSQMAIPLIFAVIGIILFANCEWRKTVNNGLTFLTGILITGTLAVSGLIGLWEGNGHQTISPVAESARPSDVQPERSAAINTSLPLLTENASLPYEKEQKDTIIAKYNIFTPVEFPPMERLVSFSWEDAPRGCVVAVIADDMPEVAKFPCDESVREIGTIRKIGFASDIPGVTLEIPIQYTYVPSSSI